MSEDPIGCASGQTNAYAYVGGNPVQFTDPDGTERARPYNGVPGSWYVHPITGDRRFYGLDGKPSLDIEGSHSHDAMCPHIHVWRDGERGGDEAPFRWKQSDHHVDADVIPVWARVLIEGSMDIFCADWGRNGQIHCHQIQNLGCRALDEWRGRSGRYRHTSKCNHEISHHFRYVEETVIGLQSLRRYKIITRTAKSGSRATDVGGCSSVRTGSDSAVH